MNTYNFKSFSEISSTISTPASVHTTEDVTGICRSYRYLSRNTQHLISASNFRAREGGWISPSPSACCTIKLLKRCSRRKSLLSQSRCTSNVGVFFRLFWHLCSNFLGYVLVRYYTGRLFVPCEKRFVFPVDILSIADSSVNLK